MTRGIISLYWGDRKSQQVERLLESTSTFHPELQHLVIELERPKEGALQLQEKARMFELSPFDETLYLDCDTIVMGRLDFGFRKALATESGVAMCICECPWARRYRNVFTGDEIEYNTGVMFFTKKSEPLFRCWQELALHLDTSIVFVSHQHQVLTMDSNDQGSFAAAVERTGIAPFVLPQNWNFRAQFMRGLCGPVKIWHSRLDPPPEIIELNHYYSDPGHIIQFYEQT